MAKQVNILWKYQVEAKNIFIRLIQWQKQSYFAWFASIRKEK